MARRCDTCDGTGTDTYRPGLSDPNASSQTRRTRDCPRCDGTGTIPGPSKRQREAARDGLRGR